MKRTMEDILAHFRENRSLPQGTKMHAVVEAKSIIFQVPRGPAEKMGEYIRRAGSFFGLTPAQSKKIVYGEVKDLRASRLDAMREKLNELQERARRRRERTDGIKQRLADLRSDHGSRDPGGRGRGDGPVDDRSLGEGESSSGTSGRPAAVAGPDAK